MTPEEFQFASRSLDDFLRNRPDVCSAAELADTLKEVPADPESSDAVDIPWLPDYLERVYGWSRKGPRP